MEWIQSQPRECAYCKLPESQLRSAGMMSSIGLPVEALGVDRVDNLSDYELGNMCLCCYACNKAKGNVFNGEEMKIIGLAIGEVWEKRASARPERSP